MRAVYQHFAMVRATLLDPFEVWFVPRQGEDGRTRFIKRYLGMFRLGRQRVVVFAERSPQGLLMRHGRLDTAEEIEGFRKGLLARTKAEKKA